MLRCNSFGALSAQRLVPVRQSETGTITLGYIGNYGGYGAFYADMGNWSTTY